MDTVARRRGNTHLSTKAAVAHLRSDIAQSGNRKNAGTVGRRIDGRGCSRRAAVSCGGHDEHPHLDNDGKLTEVRIGAVPGTAQAQVDYIGGVWVVRGPRRPEGRPPSDAGQAVRNVL